MDLFCNDRRNFIAVGRDMSQPPSLWKPPNSHSLEAMTCRTVVLSVHHAQLALDYGNTTLSSRCPLQRPSIVVIGNLVPEYFYFWSLVTGHRFHLHAPCRKGSPSPTKIRREHLSKPTADFLTVLSCNMSVVNVATRHTGHKGIQDLAGCTVEFFQHLLQHV